MTLTQNYFKNNYALVGGEGIYFQNKLLSELPSQNNYFIGNKAPFAINFFTYPVRLKITNLGKASSRMMTNKATLSLSMIPGITTQSLFFDIVDY